MNQGNCCDLCIFIEMACCQFEEMFEEMNTIDVPMEPNSSRWIQMMFQWILPHIENPYIPMIQEVLASAKMEQQDHAI